MSYTTQREDDFPPYRALLLSVDLIVSRPRVSNILPLGLPGYPGHQEPARKEEGYREGEEDADDEDYTSGK